MRFIRILAFSIFSVFFFIQTVSAATVLQFLPRTVSVKEGEKFTLTVQTIPNNDKNYTVRMVAEFPPELLSVHSWDYADDWMPLRKLGYDSLDNDRGMLMKTGGFPEGFTSPTVFGTITFIAKKGGTASVRVGMESMILDDHNNNVVALSQPTRVDIEGIIVAKPLPIPAPVPAPVPIFVAPSVPVQSASQTEKISEPVRSDTVLLLDDVSSTPVSSSPVTSSLQETISSTIAESVTAPPRFRHLKISIDKTLVGNASDLMALASLENLDDNSVNIALEYSVLDANGTQLYHDTAPVITFDEKRKISEFKNLNLKDGVYTLAVNAMQDNKIIDTQEKKFEIKKHVDTSKRVSYVLSLSVLFLLVLCFGILFRVYRENNQKSP